MIIPDDLQNFEEIYLVMNHCHTDLAKIIESKFKLDLSQVKFILWNILTGLKYMHDR